MQTHEEYLLERLDKLGLYSNGVRRLLKKTAGVIAGSFPVQCLLREEYAGSDIDFFIHQRHKRTVEKWFQKYCGGQNIGDPVGNYPKNDTRSPYMYTMDSITGVYKFIYKKACINLIFVSTSESIPDYIESNFDISFCKTMYTGRNLRFAAETLRKVGRTCYNKTHYKYQKARTAERIAKYTARGFIIFEEAAYQEQVLKTDPKYSDHVIYSIISKLPKKTHYNISYVSGSDWNWSDYERPDTYRSVKEFCRHIMTGSITARHGRIWCIKFQDFTVCIEAHKSIVSVKIPDFDGTILVAKNQEEHAVIAKYDCGCKPVYTVVDYDVPAPTEVKPARAPAKVQKHEPDSVIVSDDTPDAEAAQLARITALEQQLSRLISLANAWFE